MGYRSAMKISGPDSESPQKTSLDTGQTTPFGRGHPILISATITCLGIIGSYGKISFFFIQILILLQKRALEQVQPTKSEGKHPRLIQDTTFSRPIFKVK